jgi:hypothetical protein
MCINDTFMRRDAEINNIPKTFVENLVLLNLLSPELSMWFPSSPLLRMGANPLFSVSL